MSDTNYVFVGSYAPASEEGIHLYTLDTQDGRLTRLNGTKGVENPSFLAVDAPRQRLFAVSETAGGSVVAMRYDLTTGAIEEINRQSTEGDHPCHLITDPSGRWLLVVNYSSGNVCVYPIKEDGAIGPMSDQARHVGRSVNANRQEKPHPHSIMNIPSTPFYVVPDLGTDQLYIYELDSINGKLQERSVTKVAPGSGPRHIAFHPKKPFAYVIHELTSMVDVLEVDVSTGALKPVQSLSTLPDRYTGESYCAEVLVSSSGAYVYGSNRGHDSIVVFKTGEDGRLERIGDVSTEGKFPRNFILNPDETWLVAANQNSSSMVVMRLKENELPVTTGPIYEIEKPVCVKVISALA